MFLNFFRRGIPRGGGYKIEIPQKGKEERKEGKKEGKERKEGEKEETEDNNT
jgi:hypothetical protein